MTLSTNNKLKMKWLNVGLFPNSNFLNQSSVKHVGYFYLTTSENGF